LFEKKEVLVRIRLAQDKTGRDHKGQKLANMRHLSHLKHAFFDFGLKAHTEWRATVQRLPHKHFDFFNRGDGTTLLARNGCTL
jgi:hypothetical protein